VSTAKVSHGSLVTSDMLNMWWNNTRILQIYCRIQQWKNFKQELSYRK